MSKKTNDSTAGTLTVPVELIERHIFLIRGQKVMLDQHLAELYRVKPIALRQQVKRNPARFPDDFMFQLSKSEAALVVSQNVIPSARNFGGSLPYAFTKEGVAMLSSVLHGARAVQVNVEIMRVFVKLAKLLDGHKEILNKIDALERTQKRHSAKIRGVFEAIKQLIAPPARPKRRMGF